jgi:hypothetical protein
MKVERLAADARLFGDISHAHALAVLGLKEGAGGFQNAVSGLEVGA